MKTENIITYLTYIMISRQDESLCFISNIEQLIKSVHIIFKFLLRTPLAFVKDVPQEEDGLGVEVGVGCLKCSDQIMHDLSDNLKSNALTTLLNRNL